MNNNHSSAPIPVGFRFHPTDEELVGYYLHGKVGRAQRDQLIQELDLYKIEPWDLHEVCRIGDDAAEAQSDWYFFSHKDKKYPTGNRANRATAAGFWKATGRDKPIHMAQQHRHVIGMRKTLVFYKGRAPHGQKTDWIMHEFRLDEGPGVVPNYESDGWVVCRVFRKSKNFKTKSQDDTSCSFEKDGSQQPGHSLQLPELLSPPSHAAMKLVFNGEHLTCKQEISVEDYAGTPIHDVVSSSSYFHDHGPALVHQHLLPVGDHIQSRLAPCSSSTFREFCSRSSRPAGEYSLAPFDDAQYEDQSPYWTQFEPGHKSTGMRRDQTLADITSHVGRMKRQAMDHHETNLVHLWNV